MATVPELRVIADVSVCCGVLAAPAVFAQGRSDGVVVVLAGRVDPALRAAVAEAVDLCPTGALSLAGAP
jgi:ferredoxin